MKLEMNWVDAVTKGMNPELAPLVVALDPDRLLTEEAVQAAIHSSGYEVVKLEDEIAFRFAYETKYRDAGAPLLLIRESEQKRDVPFDVLSTATVVSPSLSSLFPSLSAPVVRGLDRGDLPALFEAQQRENPSRMNDAETKKFILLHVYGLVPEVLRAPTDLLRELLRLHYGARTIPDVLVGWLIDRLKASAALDGWPLADIVADRARFFHFLQERWPAFLYKLSGQPLPEAFTPLSPDVPFGHQDVRIYLDNMFVEGSLTPVAFPYADSIKEDWVRVGIITDAKTAATDRLGRLLELLASEIPETDARYRAWLTFAPRWAEASVLRHSLDTPARAAMEGTFQALQARIDETFTTWLSSRYSGLHSQPPMPPVMVHHIARAMARDLEDGKAKKVTLLVVDGMALNQWLVLRQVLAAQMPQAMIQDDTVFAWVPTLTSVSRQAIFSGKPPVHFGKSIGTTSKEPMHWAQFWADQGFTGKQVEYRKGLGEPTDLDSVDELLSRPQLRVIGLVVDKIDRIMHGMELGMNGMLSQVALWAETGYFSRLVGMLVDGGFSIYITADHGNVEAVGIGRPAEGVNAEERGERVRTYGTDVLRQQVKAAFPSMTEWPAIGLPADYLPVLAAGRDAFIAGGKCIVGHGGASLEEVVVPLVRIKRA